MNAFRSRMASSVPRIRSSLFHRNAPQNMHFKIHGMMGQPLRFVAMTPPSISTLSSILQADSEAWIQRTPSGIRSLKARLSEQKMLEIFLNGAVMDDTTRRRRTTCALYHLKTRS